MVTWDQVPPINQNGIITVYEVNYVPLETFDRKLSPVFVNTTTGTVLEIILEGLQEYVEYDITVRAYTTGPGPFNPVPARNRTDEAGMS